MKPSLADGDGHIDRSYRSQCIIQKKVGGLEPPPPPPPPSPSMAVIEGVYTVCASRLVYNFILAYGG